MKTAAIVGLGYVGLPLAQAMCRAGISVVGLDINRNTVAALSAGQSHVDDLSDADIAEMIAFGFRATTDPGCLSEVENIVICVPTPLTEDGQPELGPIRGAIEAIAPNLRTGHLVVLESTTFPGTTEEVVKPALEREDLHAGKGFHLAFSPERVDPGNAVYNIRNTPKIVGGFTETCTERAAKFYQHFIDTVVVARGTREAEMSKLLENTYRHINIALVNELARVSHELDIDIWDVIRCAETKPFGFQAFYPSAGVGGHCIPIDPNYLSYTVKARLGYPLRFVELAHEINNTMPRYVVGRVQALLNDHGQALRGARVLIVGVTYKQNIADQRESPAIPLARLLQEQGAVLSYLDPHVDEWLFGIERVEPSVLADEPRFDIAVILQHHSAVDIDDIVPMSRQVLDTRGRARGETVETL